MKPKCGPVYCVPIFTVSTLNRVRNSRRYRSRFFLSWSGPVRTRTECEGAGWVGGGAAEFQKLTPEKSFGIHSYPLLPVYGWQRRFSVNFPRTTSSLSSPVGGRQWGERVEGGDGKLRPAARCGQGGESQRRPHRRQSG